MKKLLYLFIALITFSSCKKDDNSLNLIGSWELTKVTVWENGQLSDESIYPVDGTRFIANFSESKIYTASYNADDGFGRTNEDTYVKDGNSITFAKGTALESLGGTLNKNGNTFILTSIFEEYKVVYTFKRSDIIIPAR